jgi:hypothetical protein
MTIDRKRLRDLALGEHDNEACAKFIAAANPQTILALLDALEAAEQPAPDDARDAKRYRWIKAKRLLDVDRSLSPGRPFMVLGGASVLVPISPDASLPSVTLDVAIDAAIQAQERTP